jgi:hypothetical protein
MSDAAPAPAFEEDPYAMANLRPADTGLPMVVWVSERAGARHDVRVKVCRVHGNAIQIDNTASVSVRPQPNVVAGNLSPADFHAVARWIEINADALVAYWDGVISTREMLQQIQPLDPPIAP